MIEITGFKEIDTVLKKMPARLSEKVLSSAHRSSLIPLVKKAKLLAPEGPTGNLVDSIGTERVTQSKKGGVQAGPKRRGRFKGNHGHLVEFGTKSRRKKSGANTGSMPAQPFMQPAFDATKDLVNDQIAEKIGTTLFRFMKRTLKK